MSNSPGSKSIRSQLQPVDLNGRTQAFSIAGEQHPSDNNTTYVTYRAELITQMTNTMFSYAEAQSPKELLEILLADARHFADANGLAFDEHHHRSYEIYLENKSDAPRETVQSSDASSTSTETTRMEAKL